MALETALVLPLASSDPEIGGAAAGAAPEELLEVALALACNIIERN